MEGQDAQETNAPTTLYYPKDATPHFMILRCEDIKMGCFGLDCTPAVVQHKKVLGRAKEVKLPIRSN